MNTNMLKGKIIEKGLSISDVAKAVGISTASMYRKINNSGNSMLIKDAYAIGKFLDLSAEEMNAIFFAHTVSNLRQTEGAQ